MATNQNLNNGDLRGLSAPKVPLKNSAQLCVNSVTLRLN
jgi:hypothetical protein